MKLQQRGQASLEFVVTFFVGLGFILLILSQGINFTAGYLAHYATFMASRTFLSYENRGSDPQSIITQAGTGAMAQSRVTFNRIADGSTFLNGDDLQFNYPGASTIAEYFGAFYKMERPFSFFPLYGGDLEMNFRSEAFLGKEPMKTICSKRLCQKLTGNEDCSGDLAKHITVYDNGC